MLVLGAIGLFAPKRARERHGRVGEWYFRVLVVTLSTGFVIGLTNEGITLFEIVTPPTLALGIIGYAAVKRRRRWFGPNWPVWHISGQSGSYVGVVTAFGFQVVPRMVDSSVLLTTALWAIPTIVGSLLIARANYLWVYAPVPRIRTHLRKPDAGQSAVRGRARSSQASQRV